MFKISDEEHTRLLFLLDAINIAPLRTNLFINVISNNGLENCSNMFLFYLDFLRNSKNILRDSKELRRILL